MVFSQWSCSYFTFRLRRLVHHIIINELRWPDASGSASKNPGREGQNPAGSWFPQSEKLGRPRSSSRSVIRSPRQEEGQGVQRAVFMSVFLLKLKPASVPQHWVNSLRLSSGWSREEYLYSFVRQQGATVGYCPQNCVSQTGGWRVGNEESDSNGSKRAWGKWESVESFQFQPFWGFVLVGSTQLTSSTW